MPKGPPPSEQRIVLEKVSWRKYEELLAEMEPQRTSRFTYVRGRLEMMTPLEEHERCHKLIESLILVLADETGLRVAGFKSPTLKRADLQLGVELDTAYYIQHEAQMRQASRIDLMADPPPDLVLEVALNKSTLDKLPIYAELGIPEIWRYTSKAGEEFWKGQFQIFCLADGVPGGQQPKRDRPYQEVTHGLAFPFLSASRVLGFIEESDSLGLMTALRNLRQWVEPIITS
jgi:Uma2 family endonuclease